MAQTGNSRCRDTRHEAFA